MRYDAPWDIVKGHHHLATPELDRWKAEQQAFPAVVRALSYVSKWISNEHRGTLRGTPGSAYPQPEPNATELPSSAPGRLKSHRHDAGLQTSRSSAYTSPG